MTTSYAELYATVQEYVDNPTVRTEDAIQSIMNAAVSYASGRFQVGWSEGASDARARNLSELIGD